MSVTVSIIIPAYNYAHYIQQAINSVLQQDYPKDKIEIIVVDDGSTDKTKAVLQTLIEDKTVQYHYQQNQGKASATYKAIQLASGKYIFNLDADDYFLHGKIKRTVEIFEADDTIVHVASPAEIFEQDKNTVKGVETLPAVIVDKKLNGLELLHYFYRNNILYGGGSTFAARANVLKQIFIPVEVDMYIDEFLVLAVLPHGKSFFLNEPLSVWRTHSINFSGCSQNAGEQQLKAQRLLKASGAVLDYLEQNKFDKQLIKIYTLKNINRQLAYKETAKTKTLQDIYKYAKDVIFSVKPGWKLIRKYQVLNRLMPLSLYLLLKKIAR
ncbi:MAG: glycosyltransferase family 2 protein [Parafilimonas sp.]|nr:glycosyltransferase family 2 protein [Parafilimonas sp.]